VKKDLNLLPAGEGECCPDPLDHPLSEAEAAEKARGFAALADPARLRLFSMIASQPGQVCACSLVEPVGRSQPTVSHHLKVLYEAGLVDRERRGSWIWYWAVPGKVGELVSALGLPDRVSPGR
jgi:ArsR family transcriptional regulator